MRDVREDRGGASTVVSADDCLTVCAGLVVFMVERFLCVVAGDDLDRGQAKHANTVPLQKIDHCFPRMQTKLAMYC